MKWYVLPVLCLFVLFWDTLSAQRIVSLTPSLTDILYELEQQDKLVGCTSFCKPAVRDGKPQVASAVKVNIESVLKLKPDLVLTSGLTDPETLAKLKGLGLRVVVFQTPKDFHEIIKQTLFISLLTNARTKGIALTSSTYRRVKAVARDMKGKDLAPSVFFQIGAKPIFGVTTGNFMDDYITRLGGTNIMADMDHGTLGRETVVSRNPDVIVIATMGNVSIEEKDVWSRFGQVNAVKNRRIFLVDAALACQPTPLAFATTLETLYGNLYASE